ncbi:MAG: hypothetical protein IKW06_02580 [Clostridia bacterium]|nr:hypothetical protein [Clostridia bacterium]
MGIFGFSKNKKYRFKVRIGDDSLRTPQYKLLEEEERFIQEFLSKCKANGLPLRKIKFERMYIGLINIFYKGRSSRVGGFNFQKKPSYVSYSINDELFDEGGSFEGGYDDCVQGIDHIIKFIKEYIEK